MKGRIVLAITGLVLLGGNEIFAQTYSEEALLVSRIRTGGTARSQAMGGVQNAIGGDLSSAYYNPAGLGMYNRSDFSITLGYNMANSSASYLGNNTAQDKNNVIVPNFGIAFHSSKDGSKGLWGGTFGISFNRINDFNSTYSYQGTNTDNSIIDYFISDANGTDESQFNSSTGFNFNTATGLAYSNYLIGPQSIIDPSLPDDQYFTDVYPYYPTQSETVKTSGTQYQWNFSYGVNFNDKIFIGGGIGFANLNYKSDKTYTETFYDPYPNPLPPGQSAISPMSKMVLNESLSLTGTGINATIGAIVRPVDAIQIGFSIATPTSYSITDNYSASMSTKWSNFQYDPVNEPTLRLNDESASTDVLLSNYNLQTPWRISGGATFFFQKHGFISAEAEWQQYGSAHYSSDNDDWSGDNKEIKGLYKSTINLRVGGEYRLNNYRFRAGYNLMPDPFQTPQNNIDRAISSYSAGVGYRTSKFYVDFAVVMGQGNSSYRPYSNQYIASPLVSLTNKATTVALTVGFPF